MAVIEPVLVLVAAPVIAPEPEPVPLLATQPRRTFTASLKGLAEAQPLVGIDVLGA